MIENYIFLYIKCGYFTGTGPIYFTIFWQKHDIRSMRITKIGPRKWSNKAAKFLSTFLLIFAFHAILSNFPPLDFILWNWQKLPNSQFSLVWRHVFGKIWCNWPRTIDVTPLYIKIYIKILSFYITDSIFRKFSFQLFFGSTAPPGNIQGAAREKNKREIL